MLWFLIAMFGRTFQYLSMSFPIKLPFTDGLPIKWLCLMGSLIFDGLPIKCHLNRWLFPTCQVRVVRFYVSCLLLSSSPLLLLLNRDPRRTVFSVGPQPRPSTPSVPCRTSTTTIPAQCSLPDLNHDHPRPVFPAGPQPRVSTPSVPCRTSCRKIWDKECAEES